MLDSHREFGRAKVVRPGFLRTYCQFAVQSRHPVPAKVSTDALRALIVLRQYHQYRWALVKQHLHMQINIARLGVGTRQSDRHPAHAAITVTKMYAMRVA